MGQGEASDRLMPDHGRQSELTDPSEADLWYHNPMPGRYTVHVQFAAGDDEQAVCRAFAILQSARQHDFVDDRCTDLSDADDWAEQTSLKCGSDGLPVTGRAISRRSAWPFSAALEGGPFNPHSLLHRGVG